MGDIKTLLENYWDELNQKIDKYYPYFNSRKPDGNNYYLPLGNKFAHITLKVNSVKKIMKCKIVISHNKELFDYLYDLKEDIESELGFDLIWNRKEGVEAHIDIVASFDIRNVKEWDRAINWHLSMAVLFYDVFHKRMGDFFSK